MPNAKCQKRWHSATCRIAIAQCERSGASGEALAERSEPGGVQGPPPIQAKDSSSIGRAPVSKTGGWGFDSLLSCQFRVGSRRQGVNPTPMRHDSERNVASDAAGAESSELKRAVKRSGHAANNASGKKSAREREADGRRLDA